MIFSNRDFAKTLICASADNAGNGGGGVEPGKPVFVVATITVKPGKRAEFSRIFLENVPNVLAEDGCVLYSPAVDVPSGIGAQIPLRENVVTVVEQWESLQALQAHLVAPHMNSYREAVKGLVDGASLQVMQPV